MTTPSFVTKLSTKGLIFSKGAEWQASKNALLPLFHKGMMHGFLPAMSTACAELLACLKSVPPSVPVDMNELLHKMAMDVIGDVALGVQFGLLRDEQQQLEGGHTSTASRALPGKGQLGGLRQGVGTKVTRMAPGTEANYSNRELYELVMEMMNLSTFEASVSNLLILLCGPMGRALRWLLSHVPGTVDHRFRHIQTYGMRSFVQMCIARKKGVVGADEGISTFVTETADGCTDSADNRGKDGEPHVQGVGDCMAPDTQGVTKDAMTFLLSAVNKETKQPFTMESVAGLATELIAAGSDTTANTLAFALYCVSGDAHVEERVVAEVLAPGRGPGEPISHEDLEERFPFVEAVVKEALRMYPPAAAMTRVASENVELGGHVIPAGTGVVIPAMAMNMDAAVYPNPDVFDPDRFLGGDGEKKREYLHQYNPFGVGPRMCLGHRFAMTEAMLVFIRLYQRFSFTRAPPTSLEVPLQVQHTVVSKPRNGMWMYVTPRESLKA